MEPSAQDNLPRSRVAASNVTADGPADVPFVTVFIVDDHGGYRSVAAAVVGATPGFVLVGSAATTGEMLEALARLPSSPDLLLLDVNLGAESGIDAARAVRTTHPATKVVLVSTLRLEELPPGFDSCGADGYLSKMQFGTTTLARVWAGAYDWAP